MRPMTLPLAAALFCLPFCAMADSSSDWLLPEVDLLTLAAGNEPSVVVTCPEAEGRLDFAVVPAWEEGYGTTDGGTFAGPYDKVSVQVGDKIFEAVEDPAATTEDYGRVYTMPADADTVTAIMLGDNITVTLIADGQERSGTVDTTGALDMFATTCAQINGL
jgi:hypothetical protein